MKEKPLQFKKLLFSEIDGWFLAIIVFIFSLLRIPSLVEPDWYGDEGIYKVIGAALASGRSLYSQIWDNKPPLLYLIYQLAQGELFYVRLLSLLAGIGSVIVFYLLTKRLLERKMSCYIATAVYAVIFAAPVIEGNIANAENFMLLPTILALYLLILNKGKNNLYLVGSGILVSVAFLIKIVAVFDFLAFMSILLMAKFSEGETFKKRKILGFLKEETTFAISFALPIILASIYFFVKGSFFDFYKAVFSQNVGYVGYGNFFLFPMGFLFLKIGLVIFSVLLILRYRKSLGLSGVIILTWLVFSVFNAMFSQRPYAHYLLVMLPSISLLAGYILDNRKIGKVVFFLGIIALIVLFQNFKVYKKVSGYYLNYAGFVFDDKPINEYLSFFDRNTPRDYEIARFIRLKTTEEEGIFIWSDSGQIYTLSGKLPPGRYIVAYHITFYKDAIDETKRAIKERQPRYIIQTKDGDEINHLLEDYELKYRMGDVKIYERQS